jgi:hypothetical protein
VGFIEPSLVGGMPQNFVPSTSRQLKSVIGAQKKFQVCVTGYFEKISSTRLNAFSAAAWGVALS